MTCEKCSRSTALKFCPWCDPVVSPIRRKYSKRRTFADDPRGPMFAKYNRNSSFNRRKMRRQAVILRSEI